MIIALIVAVLAALILHRADFYAGGHPVIIALIAALLAALILILLDI